MPRVHYEGRPYERLADESVLDALLRAGVPVSYACRSGSCGSCLTRTPQPEVLPAAAQAGLKDSWKAAGYFLACACVPEGDIVAGPAGADVRARATIAAVDRIGDAVLRVRLRPEEDFPYRAGQYLTLFRDDGLARSYSIASLPGEEIELHVRQLPGGRMSGWLASPASIGAAVRIQGPSGDCFYVPGREDQPIVLVGTGTGVAPLYGIARQALRSSHRGPVHLFHGAVSAAGLYHQTALRRLADEHPNVTCTPTTLDTDGPIERVVLQRLGALAGWRAFLCGDPAVVSGLRKKLFLAGASLNDIHADAFQPSAPAPSAASG